MVLTHNNQSTWYYKRCEVGLLDGVSSILNGNCVLLFGAMGGGGPHDICLWRGRVCNGFNAVR